MDNKPYISRIMSFITNMQIQKSKDDDTPEPGPEPQPGYVVEGRRYLHKIDVSTLNYETTETYVPEGGIEEPFTVINVYHIDGTPIVDEDDWWNSYESDGALIVREVLEKPSFHDCIVSCSQNGVGIFLYSPDRVGETFEFGTLGMGPFYGDYALADERLLNPETFVDGYVKQDTGEFYYNLVSETVLKKEGVQYSHLFVHDLREYSKLTDNGGITSEHIDMFGMNLESTRKMGFISLEMQEQEEVGPLRPAKCIFVLDVSGLPEDEFEIYPTDDVSVASPISTANVQIENAYAELVGSQLFIYYNLVELPPILGE